MPRAERRRSPRRLARARALTPLACAVSRTFPASSSASSARFPPFPPVLSSAQVGIHIADVGHFIKAGTPIDEEAALRATTVYAAAACPALPGCAPPRSTARLTRSRPSGALPLTPTLTATWCSGASTWCRRGWVRTSARSSPKSTASPSPPSSR